MKLESKLGVSTGILVSAMLLSAVTAHIRIAEANRFADSVTRKHVPLIFFMHGIGSDLNESVQTLQSYMLFGVKPEAAAGFLAQRRQHIAHAEAAVAAFHRDFPAARLDTESRDRIQRIQADIPRLDSLEEQIERLNESHADASIARAYELLGNDLLSLDGALDHEILDLTLSEEALTRNEMERLNRANHTVLETLWIATLLSAVFGAAFSFLLTRRIARSIRRIADRANEIAAGDLTGDAIDTDSTRQFGELSLAMREMQSSLAAVIGTVAATARTLTASADSMHTAGDLIHRRIDEQSQQTQQAATALQQMSASIAEVSHHAQSAADTARSAAQTAREGGGIVQQMLASMACISSAVSDTSATVTLLGDDSKRISQIVTVIGEITRKTNLLALNAAIEAARAGEQGRGFAVVASEVRRLAESTARATEEISAMVRGIQDRTQTAIASMASGTITVDRGVATTHHAGEALERIIGMAERVDRMIAQIAIAATQQAIAANQSSGSLHSIYTLSHENLCEMATTAAGIESLRATAVALEQQVVRFRLEETSQAPLTSHRPPRTHGVFAHV